MRVDKPRERVESLAVDRLGALGRGEGVAQLGNLPIANQQVGPAVEPGARVEQPGAADEHRGGAHGRAVELDLAAACRVDPVHAG